MGTTLPSKPAKRGQAKTNLIVVMASLSRLQVKIGGCATSKGRAKPGWPWFVMVVAREEPTLPTPTKPGPLGVSRYLLHKFNGLRFGFGWAMNHENKTFVAWRDGLWIYEFCQRGNGDCHKRSFDATKLVAIDDIMLNFGYSRYGLSQAFQRV